jgi:hypothetical protein
VLDQTAEYSSSEDTEFSYTGIAIPRISGLVGNTGDFYVSAGFTYQNNPQGFIPELLRTDLTLRFDRIDITIGRMSYNDPLGYIASGLFDGFRVTIDTDMDMGSISAGAWYTGLLYKKRVNIEMTQNEYAANNTALDYGDFANSYFAPRRVLAALDWEHKGLLEKGMARISLLGQFDLTEEEVNSQYIAGKIKVPFGAFNFDLGGCFEIIEANNKTGSAFALEATFGWRNPVHFFSLGAKYSSGESDTLAAFLPLTTNTQGHVLETKLSGITMVSLDYMVKLHETLSAGLYPAYFLLTDPGSGDKNRLGAEIYAAVFWSPVPDISVNLGGGAFMPSLGNTAPDEKIKLRVELHVVISLF